MRIRSDDLLASIVRESFFDFLREFWGVIIQEEPVFNWHVHYLCDQLQDMAERVFEGQPKEYDLVINVPPGSTKSTICSQMFPAWAWTRMPHARFICAGYAHMIALKDALRTRDIVQSQLYQRCFPNIQLREDQNTKGLFINTLKGERFSAGIGGAVTGNHAHFLLVDDPLNPEEAFSEVQLKAANRWMETTLPTRKVDKEVTPTILIQQRLHQSDPSGKMLERGGVKHICLPGEVTEKIQPPALRKYYQDGLLDPRRLPRKVLKEIEQELGAYGYASQILQEPVPLGGGLFKVDRFHLEKEPHRRIVRMVRAWDKAGTEDGGNWTAGVKMGLDLKGFWWVLNVVRGQWGSTEREETIRRTAELDGEAVDIELEIEGGSGGKESAENTVRNLAGFRVRAKHPTGDKETRAYPFSSQVGAGNVYVLIRDWTEAFIEEHRYFPRGTHDDQVDAASAAFNRLARKRRRVGGVQLGGGGQR